MRHRPKEPPTQHNLRFALNALSFLARKPGEQIWQRLVERELRQEALDADFCAGIGSGAQADSWRAFVTPKGIHASQYSQCREIAHWIKAGLFASRLGLKSYLCSELTIDSRGRVLFHFRPNHEELLTLQMAQAFDAERRLSSSGPAGNAERWFMQKVACAYLGETV